MIAIGSFIFPEETTLLQVSQIEAKSKVRKEIRIKSMIECKTEAALQDDLSQLRAAVEAFDHQQTYLSLSRGRFYQGRQRAFQMIPFSQESLAWVDLLLLTHDRYERSLAEHRLTLPIYYGRADFSLFSQGNWYAPPVFSITPSQSLTAVHVFWKEGTFSVRTEIPEEHVLTIDSENRKVLMGENNLFAQSNEDFPTLSSGHNQLGIRVEPETAEALCSIQYRDFWV